MTHVRLPDYLWGIETKFFPSDHFLSLSCFQTTYEELKLWSGTRDPSSLRFQTTYEELKPDCPMLTLENISKLPDYLWGIETGLSVENNQDILYRFQTTYEELKHLSIQLPISWTISGFQTTYEELKLFEIHSSNALPKLPDYLWGIETSLPCTLRQSRRRASRLPMRNWNRRYSLLCRMDA